MHMQVLRALFCLQDHHSIAKDQVMAEPGQKFLQKLLDGKIHECEYVEPFGEEYIHQFDKLARNYPQAWVARVIDNHGGYQYGQRFLCDPCYS